MGWRVANSLLVLRNEINAAHPSRTKGADGTIGDAAHQSQGSDSDHNPWVHLYGDTSTGVVTALDITHDPAHGCDINPLTDKLAATRDPRIKYVIANALILSGNDGPAPWVWRAYGGSDPHTNHFHLSVVASPLCDDTRPWNIASSGGSAMAVGDADKAFSEPYTGTESWVSGQSWMSKAVEGPLREANDKLDKLSQRPAATVAMTAVDRADIAAQVLAQLPKPPTAAEIAEELARRIGNG